MRSLFLILIFLSCKIAFAEPVNEVMLRYRTQIGMESPHAISSYNTDVNLQRMNEQLLAQRYPNSVRLNHLTQYFQSLYLSGLSSNLLSDVNQAIAELERIKVLALSTEGVNPDASSWTDPRLQALKEHQSNLQLKQDYATSIRNAVPSSGNPCMGCSDPQTCHRNWAMRKAEEDKPRLWKPPCKGTCGDPHCGKGWTWALAAKYQKNYPHFTPPPAPVSRPIPPVSSVSAPSIVEEEERGRPRERLAPGQRHRTPSPGLERSFPELTLVPLIQRAILPASETITSIVTTVIEYRDQFDYPRIRIPYGEGWASQDMSHEAIALREEVTNGAELFRLGTRGHSAMDNNAQFWSFQNPRTFEGYGPRHAMPLRNFERADFIQRARLTPESNNFVVRRVEPYQNPVTNEFFEGDQYEVVIPRNSGQFQNQPTTENFNPPRTN